MNHQQEKARRMSLARPALLGALLMLMLVTVTAAWAQDITQKKRRTGDEAGTFSSRDLEQTDDGLPREIGKILESSEAALQVGNNSVRYIRRIANTTYDWLLHLRISLVENDLQSIRYDRENCELLYELITAANPSGILLADLQELKQSLAERESGSCSAAFLHLQLNVEKYDFLYPLADLGGMLGAIMRLQRDRKWQQCDLSVKLMQEAVALPNVDGPITGSLASFQTALDHLDAGHDGEARKELKNAAKMISLLNVGAFLTESQWYLAKADDALKRRLYGIALASFKKADGRLEDAEDRAWPEFAQAIATVRTEVSDLIDAAGDRERKLTLSSQRIRTLARRIDEELRIPY